MVPMVPMVRARRKLLRARSSRGKQLRNLQKKILFCDEALRFDWLIEWSIR